MPAMICNFEKKTQIIGKEKGKGREEKDNEHETEVQRSPAEFVGTQRLIILVKNP